MAKCEFCGKDVKFGIKVSHSHRRSNRTFPKHLTTMYLQEPPGRAALLLFVAKYGRLSEACRINYTEFPFFS